MVGIGLEVLSGLGLLGVVGSGLAGLPEDDLLSVSTDGEGTGGESVYHDVQTYTSIFTTADKLFCYQSPIRV